MSAESMLEGIGRRMAEMDSIIRLLIADRVVQLLEEHSESDAAIKAMMIYHDLFLGEGQYSFNQFVQSVKEIPQEDFESMPKFTKRAVLRFIDYLIQAT